MNGLIALVGAGEYLPVMDEIDRHLLASVDTNGRTPRVVCLPTAAGQEGDASVGRWLRMGVEHFEALGAEVTPAHIIDRASADDPTWKSDLENADLIYFSGGNPMYLYETMLGSRAWDSAQRAWERGAVYAGCSAGAMILAQRVPNFRAAGLVSIDGFQIIPPTFVIPHFDRVRGLWSAYLFAFRRQLKGEQFILGVDEDTALVGTLSGSWQVMGKSQAHIITRNDQKVFTAGEEVSLLS
ncbi:MAG: Type 1 glutamine amidotransferase-like domain-containing protein [Anaerolineales bacterium]|jgi:cyanophycinase